MDKSEYFRTATEILRELGITSPDEIDIEAIAFHCGATIRYRPLTGCAARIVGNGNKAIITVDSNSIRARQRFSAGHELGHWMHDRAKASFSFQEEQFVRNWSATSNPESRANHKARETGCCFGAGICIAIPARTSKALARVTVATSFGKRFTVAYCCARAACSSSTQMEPMIPMTRSGTSRRAQANSSSISWKTSSARSASFMSIWATRKWWMN